MNLATLVLHHGTTRPDKVATIDAAGAVDYGTAAARVQAFAARLAAAGAGPGRRIGLALGEHADHLLLHFAVALTGATIVPVDWRWTPAEKGAVARAFACHAVVIEPDDPARDAVPALPFDRSWRDGAPLARPEPDDDDLPLVLSLSSGTTGRPTGAIVSHRQQYERFVNQWGGMGLSGADRFVLATPLYFGGGRGFTLSILGAGGTVIFAPPNRPREIIDTIRQHEATAAFVVPTQITRMIQAWDGERPAMPSLRRFVTSGAAIHPDEKRRAIDVLTPALMDYYATSEGGGIAVLAPEEQLAYPETVGRPAFRVEIEVVDENGQPLSRNAIGRLRYRGPGVSTRLVDAEGRLTEGPAGGWFYPGDLARILPSGHVQLAGRVKDMIIRGGVNIYPAEIEAALSTHPAVVEAGAFGVPDPELGEELAVAVVLRAGTRADAAAIQEFLRGRLAPYKVPRRVAFIAALPRNPNGKVIRDQLRPLVEAAAPPPGG
ncbi:MAG TPA: AMP-binding protein [Hyphomicrobiales bacterium]|nr:AMP-binding protein [Hyphomicrobiales bacterium]